MQGGDAKGSSSLRRLLTRANLGLKGGAGVAECTHEVEVVAARDRATSLLSSARLHAVDACHAGDPACILQPNDQALNVDLPFGVTLILPPQQTSPPIVRSSLKASL